MAKVDVKLSHELLVNGRIQPAGTIVEMDPKIAAEFGKVQRIEIPKPKNEQKPKQAKKSEEK